MSTLGQAEIAEFDEEACRDFLTLELGHEIPRHYRYAEGIHEVQKRLILCYGDKNIAKAMGVFYDLLEGEDNASGLGDDGDFWRTWRHDFKLRKEDFSNPGTPRFSEMILPAAIEPKRPTSLNRYNRTSHNERSQSHSRSLQPEGIEDLASKKLSRNLLKLFNKERRQMAQISEPHDYDGGNSRRLRGMSAPEQVYLSHPGIVSTNQRTRENTIYERTRRSDDPPPPYRTIGSFDGAADEPDVHSKTLSGGDEDSLRKIGGIRGVESLTSPSLRDPDPYSSGSTYLSSYLSSRSSKQDFPSATRNFLQTYQRNENSPAVQNASSLDPEKYSPAPSPKRNNKIQNLYKESMDLSISGPFERGDEQEWAIVPEESVPYHANDINRSPSVSRMAPSSQQLQDTPSLEGCSQGDPKSHLSDFSTEEIRGRPIQSIPERKLPQLLGEIEIPQSPTRERSQSPIKKMFGGKSWLGRSRSMKEFSPEKESEDQKKGLKLLSGKNKQRVDEIVEDKTRSNHNTYNPDGSSKRHYAANFPVSLDPPLQAKLYSELELMICVTTNAFLMKQSREGRMSVESLQRVIHYWKSKGRPQVVEFQFDQATQRDLILHNLKNFCFHGEHAENDTAINSMMYTWKTMTREMAIRTFCTPDSVIRKHLHDLHLILDLLGAPPVTFLAFQDIQLNALKVMNEAQKVREDYRSKHGVERPWNPPAAATGLGAQFQMEEGHETWKRQLRRQQSF